MVVLDISFLNGSRTRRLPAGTAQLLEALTKTDVHESTNLSLGRGVFFHRLNWTSRSLSEFATPSVRCSGPAPESGRRGREGEWARGGLAGM